MMLRNGSISWRCFAFVMFGTGAHLHAADPGEKAVASYLEEHCIRCHGPEKKKGKVRFDLLSEVNQDNVDLWKSMKEMVQFEDMPPEDETQPKKEENRAFMDWVTGELNKTDGALTDQQSLYNPAQGNLVDHEKLFDGSIKGLASSPPRFWRRSQSQYDALMEELWVIPKLRYERTHRRRNPEHAAFSYSQPFPQMDPKHFSNYSGGVHGDEAVMRALMSAGTQIAERLTSDKPAYNKDHQPPTAKGVPSIRRGSVWEKFKVDPPARPGEFEPFLKEGAAPTADEQQAAVVRVFKLVLDRQPGAAEVTRYGALLDKMVDSSGALAGLRGLISAVFVSPEFVFRMEVGMGPEDAHGRRLLAPNELVYAIAYALSDQGPDQALWDAAQDGKLKTKADVEREVRRILADDSLEKHRKLRFFQEFFGYTGAQDVFKDRGIWPHEVQYLVRDTDMLVEHVLKKDRDVFAELLTTDRYFVAYPNIKNPKLFEAIIEKTINETKTGIEKTKQRGKEIGPSKNGEYSRAWAYTQGFELIPRTVHNDRGGQELSYIKIYGIDGNTFSWTRKQPIEVPGRRAGILTHPAWLVAHSTNTDNYVVGRGHWIRENLLAGKIPDVPIDVEAQVPDEPESTLRERMRVTRADYCIKCHKKMDPLGFPFEIYDHYGQFREKEFVGDERNSWPPTNDPRSKPIDPSGAIIESGEADLDGEVSDAIDLVHKLAKSPRVRQSFVRHAFRYWMGRNEMLSDSPTMIAADRAYLEHDGSFNEMLVSLLTSDSFLYRK